MNAMQLSRVVDMNQEHAPLEMVNLPVPEPGIGEILIRISACGVCHTELDEIEGRLPPGHLPIIPGHQVVGQVEDTGPGSVTLKIGDRVGASWFYSACGSCQYCLTGNENLCRQFKGTGKEVDGGYAEYMVLPESSAIPIPAAFTDIEAAPHLCAGAIGYRSVRLSGIKDGQALGLTGFGASAHLVLKLVRWQYPNSEVFVFSRSQAERDFALELGAAWAGDTSEDTLCELQVVIDTTPAWKPVVEAMKNLAPGGRLVINAIRKEQRDKDYLMNLDYPSHLWMEKEIKSVANVTRQDAVEFMQLAARIPIIPEVQEFELEEANQALLELKDRKIRGAKVLNVRH
ncbi:MAG: alcohol dehydrogenase [Chloroflexi bacterium RBG_16_54_18]|nr:MAG: alcohol dehydrogenase [Chloroflexi bacterium RBG_16_54_18]